MSHRLLSLLLASGCTGFISQPGENPSLGTPGFDGMAMGMGGASGVGAAGSGVGVMVPPIDPVRPQDTPCMSATPKSRIWRLTSAQYERTVNALIPNANTGAPVLGVDSAAGGFSTNSAFLNLTTGSTASVIYAAERYAPRVLSGARGFAPCMAMPAGFDDVACVRAFVQAFGRQAFRRPLEQAEVDSLATFYSTNKARFSGQVATGMVVRTILQSPHFLFRTELGSNAPAGSELTAFERASVLAYSLTDGPPDSVLLAAAQSGALSSAAEIEVQARRLMAKPEAEAPVARFGVEWVESAEVEDVAKDQATFPRFTAVQAEAMRDELEAFTKEVVFRGEGSLNALLTSPVAVLTRTLGGLYGVPQVTTTAPQKVTLPSGERSGLLTRMAVMTVHATDTQTSPVHRGLLVRNRFLCNGPLQVPANIPPAPPPDPTKTHREQLVQHAIDPACAGCHQQFDPLGFAFENYDGVGVYRSRENNVAIDATGVARGVASVDIAHVGALDLSQKLATLPEAQRCFAQQLGQSYLGYQVPSNSCALQKSMMALQAPGSKGTVDAVIAYIVDSALALRQP
jgi:hypothetical protein